MSNYTTVNLTLWQRTCALGPGNEFGTNLVPSAICAQKPRASERLLIISDKMAAVNFGDTIRTRQVSIRFCFKVYRPFCIMISS